MQKAVNIFKEHDFRLLPVLQADNLAGVVSEADVRRATTANAEFMDIKDVLYRSFKLKIRGT